jgi:CBS domain-containing protein
VRLDSIGFERVFDYVAGKSDWMAYALPVEGAQARRPRAGGYVRRDVPTCRLDERVAEVRQRVRDAGWKLCLVVNDRTVLLGRLRHEHMEEAVPEAKAEDVMESGPSTIRPDVPLEEVVKKLRDQERALALVTTPAGVVLGVLFRADAERALA